MSKQALTLRQQLAICQQVAALARARLPLVGRLTGSLPHLSDAEQAAAEQVERELAAGKTLAGAIAQDNSRDSRILTACIEAGERAGALDKTLEAWTEMHIANAGSDKSLRSALIYPVLLIVVTLCSLGYVIWRLIPEYRTTYTLFNQPLPQWLETIVQIREQFAICLAVMLLVLVLPLIIWAWRRRTINASGLPRDAVRRLRAEFLSTRLAAIMLQSQLPLAVQVPLCIAAMGGTTADREQGFERLTRQQRAKPLARETSMVLSSLHMGMIRPVDAIQHLNDLSNHFRNASDVRSLMQAHWLPMLIALVVGLLTVLTYVLLIYLPWVALLQKLVTPEMLVQ